jgi:hypothetical protein
MTKATIVKLWLAGLAVLIAGLAVAGISLGLMLAYGGSYVAAPTGNGYEFVPRLDGFFWGTVGFMIVGGVIAAVGATAQLAAWIGAMVNTYPLADKTWFVILLAGGLIGLSFGLLHLGVMIAYIVAGPDEAALRRPAIPTTEPQPQRPPALAHSG